MMDKTMEEMTNIYFYEKPATIGILLMFISSGFSKIFSSQTRSFDIERTKKVLGIGRPYMLSLIHI